MLLKDFILAHKKVIITLSVLVGLLLTIFFMQRSIDKLTKDLNSATINNKAYAAKNSGLLDSNRMFMFTIDQLKDSKDSSLVELNKTKKELGIKDSKLVAAQHTHFNFNKKDTTILRDTAFIKGLDLDTIIGDKHYSLGLHLTFPKTITSNIKINNTRDVLINSKKETIDPPKKFFLLRWFQKKQEVILVNVKDSNPYITKGQDVYIQIIKKN